MKCEKCGVAITEGTLCENCKSIQNVNGENTETVKIVDVVENVPASENVKVEEQPDVMNMIDEKTEVKENFMESFNKTEIENSIPLGDNLDVPAVPENENVVVVKDPIVEEESTPEVVNNEVVEQPQEVTNNTQEPVVEVKKKSKVSVIIITLVVLVAIAFIAYKFLLK